MKQFVLILMLLVILTSCSSPTTIPTPTLIPPTPTPITPRAISLFMEKESMNEEQAKEALAVLNSIGVEDITRLDYNRDDVPGKWYSTDFQGFPNSQIYVSNDKLVKKVSDEAGKKFFYNSFSGGVKLNVNSFILKPGERETFIKLALQYVPNGLKAPTSAQFPDISSDSWGVSRNGDYVEVTGIVDAQNSFGVLLRNSFEIDIDYVTRKPTNLIIEGKRVY